MLPEFTHDAPEYHQRLPRYVARDPALDRMMAQAAYQPAAPPRPYPAVVTPPEPAPPWPRWTTADFGWMMLVLGLCALLVGVPLYLAIRVVMADENPALAFLVAFQLAFAASELMAFAVALMVGRQRGHSWGDFGFRMPSLMWLVAAVITSVVLLPVRVMLLLQITEMVDLPEFSAPSSGPAIGYELNNTMIIAIGIVLVNIVLLAPLIEEFFFRGILYSWLRGRFGVLTGVLVSSILFGLVHLDPAMMIAAGVMGLALAVFYELSRSLWVPILMHFVNNALIVVLLVLVLVALTM